jgi:hypothetical protein
MHSTATKPMSFAEGLESALRLTRDAIDILDKIAAPADIAAHLDLGAHRLVKAIKDTQRS